MSDAALRGTYRIGIRRSVGELNRNHILPFVYFFFTALRFFVVCSAEQDALQPREVDGCWLMVDGADATGR